MFTVRINKSLTEFVNSWHNHPISSVNNMTPLQLFYVRLAESQEDSNVVDYTAPTVADHVMSICTTVVELRVFNKKIKN